MANNGLLSQIVDNIIIYKAQVASIQNLPQSAQALQSQTIVLFSQDIDNIRLMQQDVLSYTTRSLPLLNSALDELQDGDNISALTIIKTVNSEAQQLKITVNDLSISVINTKPQLIDFSNTLVSINQVMQNQIIELQQQAANAQTQMDQANKDKYYWLLLGPLGLAGVAAAVAMFIVWNNKANDIKSKLCAMNAQIIALQTFISNTSALISDFSIAISQISNVLNAINFLSSDIQNVVVDLNKSGSGSSSAIAYLNAAISEIQTVITDAS